MRPDREEKPDAEEYGGAGSALLKQIRTLTTIANTKLKSGLERQAFAVLRRAHLLAQDHIRRAKEGKDPRSSPSARLASAIVHVHMCASLSRLDRHPQALSEAQAAAADMDAIWRAMLDGSIETEQALYTGDTSRLPESIHKILGIAPLWLEQAVEVTVQAKQCVAIEMEFVGPPSDAEEEACSAWWDDVERHHADACKLAQRLLPDDHEARAHTERAARHKDTRRQGLEGGPSVGAPTESEVCFKIGDFVECISGVGIGKSGIVREIDADGDPKVLFDGEVAQAKLYHDFSKNFQKVVCPEPSNVSGGLPDMLKQTSRQRLPFVANQAQKKLEEMSATISTACPSSPNSSKTMFNSMSASTMSATTAGGWDLSFMPRSPTRCKPEFRNDSPPAGDVYRTTWGGKADKGSASRPREKVIEASLPKRPPSSAAGGPKPPGQGGSENPVGARSGARQLVEAQARRKREAKAAEKPLDAFQDWSKNVCDKNRMTLTQLKMQTHEGVNDLRLGLKRDGIVFKSLTFRELNPENLHDNRVMFSETGLKSIARADRRKDAFRQAWYQPTSKEIARKKQEAAMYKEYGVRCSSEPNIRALHGVLLESAKREQIARLGYDPDKVPKRKVKTDMDHHLAGFGASLGAGQERPKSRAQHPSKVEPSRPPSRERQASKESLHVDMANAAFNFE